MISQSSLDMSKNLIPSSNKTCSRYKIIISISGLSLFSRSCWKSEIPYGMFSRMFIKPLDNPIQPGHLIHEANQHIESFEYKAHASLIYCCLSIINFRPNSFYYSNGKNLFSFIEGTKSCQNKHQIYSSTSIVGEQQVQLSKELVLPLTPWSIKSNHFTYAITGAIHLLIMIPVRASWELLIATAWHIRKITQPDKSSLFKKKKFNKLEINPQPDKRDLTSRQTSILVNLHKQQRSSHSMIKSKMWIYSLNKMFHPKQR